MKSNKKEIYYIYKISNLEKIFVFLLSIIIGYFLGGIFYKNIIGRIISILLTMLYMKKYFFIRKLKIKNNILEEFLVLNNIIIGEISTGISVDTAYKNLYLTVQKNEYSGINLLKEEIFQWNKKIELGYKIENILKEFANNVNDEDIKQFVIVFQIAKRQGSNIIKVLESVNLIIKSKITIKKEIEVLVAEKKLEQKIISIMPFFMLFILKTISYDFVSPLYETLFGQVAMTILLLLFLSCYIWSQKIINIIY